LIQLAPGERKVYDLEIRVINHPNELKNLLKINNH